jgi:hypothetical protein
MLDSLRRAGAREQAAELAWMLDSLRMAGARERAAALAARGAAHVPLDNPAGVARLLDSLRAAGAHQQAAELLARDPAAHAPLDNPGPPRVFRTAKLMLIHAASCRFRYSSWTSCGVL